MKNGEKYKSASERAAAFDKWCKANRNTNQCRNISCPMCSFAWLDIEAEDEKPLPCPFCGSRTVVCVGYLGRPAVDCTNNSCHYVSSSCDTATDAILAHNRVAKAVKESEAS